MIGEIKYIYFIYRGWHVSYDGWKFWFSFRIKFCLRFYHWITNLTVKDGYQSLLFKFFFVMEKIFVTINFEMRVDTVKKIYKQLKKI